MKKKNRIALKPGDQPDLVVEEVTREGRLDELGTAKQMTM